MTESSPIARTVAAGILPLTRTTLAAALRDLGVREGDLLIVHSSMSALGYVVGGAQTIVESLLDVLGDGGTLVMPSFTGDRGDPAPWRNPPVPEAWWDLLRENMPAFDPRTSPSRAIGAVSECFRTWPGTLRSYHPADSFVARGPLAERIVASHPLSPALGETSPLGRLYDLGARVLLLGVTHGNNSSLHLAECRARAIRLDRFRAGAPILVDGARRWVTYDEWDYDSDDFERLGDDFEREVVEGAARERRATIGVGTARLCEQRDVIDYGVRWLERNRPAG